jgi:uncharacterized protein (TIGR02996 family)
MASIDVPGLDALLRALAADPADALTKLAIADLYEEHGNPGAAGAWRWLARTGKRPYSGGESNFLWFNRDTISTNLLTVDPESNIPGAIYECLVAEALEANHKIFPTREQAHQAFLAAFQQAIEAGWEPGEGEETTSTN